MCVRYGSVTLLHACACEGRRNGEGKIGGWGGLVVCCCMHVPVRAGEMGREGCVMGGGGGKSGEGNQ